MDNLDSITTVDDLLKAQTEEAVDDPTEEEEDIESAKGQELVNEIRELRPDIWLKVARTLICDSAQMHRDITVYLSENGSHDKALNWAYDTSSLEMALRILKKVKLS